MALYQLLTATRINTRASLYFWNKKSVQIEQENEWSKAWICGMSWPAAFYDSSNMTKMDNASKAGWGHVSVARVDYYMRFWRRVCMTLLALYFLTFVLIFLDCLIYITDSRLVILISLGRKDCGFSHPTELSSPRLSKDYFGNWELL